MTTCLPNQPGRVCYPCSREQFAAQSALPQIYGWESSNALEVPTAKWIRTVAQGRAFPADITNVVQYIRDIDHLMIKNHPEFRCYRDIVFYYKLFLCPQSSAFPTKAAYTQRHAKLEFFYHDSQVYSTRVAHGPASSLRRALGAGRCLCACCARTLPVS